MPSIELDIIKQRIDKLTREEKRDLIEYLTASLADDEVRPRQNVPDLEFDDPTNDDLKVA